MKKINVTCFKYCLLSKDDLYFDLNTYKVVCNINQKHYKAVKEAFKLDSIEAKKNYLVIPLINDKEDINIKKEFILSIKDEEIKEEFNKINEENFYREFFQHLSVEYDLEIEWYEFEDKKLEDITVKWCEDNNLNYYFSNQDKWVNEEEETIKYYMHDDDNTESSIEWNDDYSVTGDDNWVEESEYDKKVKNIVQSHLKKWNPIKLLEGETLSIEYDIESTLIANKIKKDMDKNSLAERISSVLLCMFNINEETNIQKIKKDTYKVAEEILEDIEKCT